MRYSTIWRNPPALRRSEVMRPVLKTLYEDDALQIRYAPGSSDRMVIAFAGVGHGLGAIQQDEFIGASTGSGENHALFVTDLHRSWYSADGMAKRIVDTVQDCRDDAAIKHTATLGNSMGGYGALLFGEMLNAQIAIGFVPQFTMNLSVIKERRWKEYRPAMVETNLDTAAPKPGGTAQRFAIFGAELPRDLIHADHFDTNDRTVVLRLPGEGHNIAHKIKTFGLLAPLINSMLKGDAQEVRTIERAYCQRLQAAIGT